MLKMLNHHRTPQNLLLLIDGIGLTLLYLYRDQLDNNILIAGVIIIGLIYFSNMVLTKISTGDHYIFLIVSMLASIGIIMIYRINPEYGMKQAVWFVIGILSFFLFYYVVKYIKGWENWTREYVLFSMGLFVATLVFGTRVKGAINWIKVGGFGFQPAEMIKLSFVFFLASYFQDKKHVKNEYVFLGIIYAHIGFLFLQRDLGSALLFFLIFIVIYYIYEEKRWNVLYNVLGAAVPGIVSYFFVNHVKVRVETWIDPWRYIDSKGYQITQSLFAIASGGFFGTGLGLGHPEFIPEVHNDFIFSAICEEMGIFGGIAIIMLFFIFVYRGFKIALGQNHRFYRIIALGITAMFGFQSFIILGGVIKLVPLTGVTLPFVSYGGSSLVSSFAALGILQAASEEQEEDYGQRIQEDH
ncbi:MAG: FtsW/RodA/SpoVE family cell cycle protein [Bacillota bacterium]